MKSLKWSMKWPLNVLKSISPPKKSLTCHWPRLYVNQMNISHYLKQRSRYQSALRTLCKWVIRMKIHSPSALLFGCAHVENWTAKTQPSRSSSPICTYSNEENGEWICIRNTQLHSVCKAIWYIRLCLGRWLIFICWICNLGKCTRKMELYFPSTTSKADMRDFSVRRRFLS